MSIIIITFAIYIILVIIIVILKLHGLHKISFKAILRYIILLAISSAN